MSEQLGPGSIFAGCRLEAVAGRGGMGVVYRATQLALQRPVALKAITPEFAADKEYRERFTRESHLAASIDHPNIIPVYEAGESGETLYLIMRWAEGTDLRTRLTRSGRLSAPRAVRLLRPVASALGAAHRRGLIHRDIKPANVLITRGEQEDEEHIYLTDFGIARQTGGESLARTGLFVGTIDYAAPERIEGGRGDAPSDIYSFGCMLFEAVTGHVPFDLPTDVSKMFAHMNDPIPSARAEVDGVPEEVDAIIVKAMAKRPDARFGSAGELTAAMAQVLAKLETAERETQARAPDASVTKIRRSPVVTEPAAVATDPIVSPPAAAATEAAGPPITSGPGPTRPGPPPAIPVAPGPGSRRRRPRAVIGWLCAIALLAGGGGVAAVLAAGGGKTAGTGSGPTAAANSTPAAGSSSPAVAIHGAGLTKGFTTNLASPPGGIAVGGQSVWISLPNRGEVIDLNPSSGSQRVLTTGGIPTVLAAGPGSVWVAGTGSRSVTEFNGESGQQLAVAQLPGTPTAIAADDKDGSVWVADSSGAVTHVATGGATSGMSARTNPAGTDLGVGEGWVWVTNGADEGLIRVSSNGDGSSTTFNTHPGPVAVTLDQGVWTAHANGHVTRFDPRLHYLHVNADVPVSSALDGIAAAEQSSYVWAFSKSARTLYRITNSGSPAQTGTVVFGSPPVAVAATTRSVWVATEDGRITEIRF